MVQLGSLAYYISTNRSMRVTDFIAPDINFLSGPRPLLDHRSFRLVLIFVAILQRGTSRRNDMELTWGQLFLFFVRVKIVRGRGEEERKKSRIKTN